MKILLALFVLIPSLLLSQDLVVNHYGDKEDEPVLFLHGGPNGSSLLFEALTVDSLVKEGYYVLTYDRRGEGRSEDTTAEHTYEEMIKDINRILDNAGVEKIILLSSSLGGYVGIKYSYEHPERVKMFIMTDLGLYQKIAIDSILVELKKKYAAENDSTNLGHAQYLLDQNKECSNWVHWTTYTLAADAGIRDCKYDITPERDSLIKRVSNSTDRSYGSRAHKLWGSNTNYSCEDLRDDIRYIVSQGVEMRTILGDSEILISDFEIEEMKRLLGEENVKVIEDGCHGVLVFRMDEALNYLLDALSQVTDSN